ncbi:MAG: hypothetical protein K0Q97_2967, partial [Bacillota bacterium]|nr:hypothetical protein [Bacillota bacterium]
FLIFIILFLNWNVIFQEGNPLPLIKGIVQLNKESFVKINEDPVTYMTKAGNKNDLFNYIEKENEVKFKEQMGSGHLFESVDKNLMLVSKQYTKFYQVWYESIHSKDNENKKEIENLVIEFGKKLKNVSLLAPKDVLYQSMDENYAKYITDDLLQKWKSDPQNALGKLVSSPWPERIDIKGIEKINESEYIVKGFIIELTSNEIEYGGIAAKRPVELNVINSDNKWVISGAKVGEYVDINTQ